MEARLRESGLSAFSLESRRPLEKFDIIGFSLLYELNYTNILTLLDLSRIPFYAAQRALPEDIRHMGTVIAGMEQNLEGLSPSEDLDANFHILVARATHNIVWLHLMQNIFDAMKEFQQSVWRAVYITGDDHHILYSHHRNVFEAIEARDAEAARDAMMLHLNFAEQRSIAFIKQSLSQEN